MKFNLLFEDLRKANAIRLPLFKNSKGVVAHSKSDGSDWTLLEWAGALCGEAGELANLLKKVRRGDKTLDEARTEIAKELADNVIYLDIIAQQAGIDLGRAVVQKFNETSQKSGVDVFLTCDDEPDYAPGRDLADRTSDYAAQRARDTDTPFNGNERP